MRVDDQPGHKKASRYTSILIMCYTSNLHVHSKFLAREVVQRKCQNEGNDFEERTKKQGYQVGGGLW